MRYKTYQVSPEAVVAGCILGLFGDTAKRLSRMARRAAPFTSEVGNRRFDEFVLNVVEDRVLGVTFLPQT
jgi:hypothetical protein